MFAWLIGPTRFFVRALAAHDSPRQLAIGFALGVVIGLLPKDNLTAFLFVVALFATRVNIGAGLASCAFCSLAFAATDPFAHKLGWLVLSYRPLQNVYATVFDAPLVAWTELNNTVVAGRLLISLFLMIPALLFGERAFAKLRPPVAARIGRRRIGRLLFGFDVATRWSHCE